ncbi:hypothetical protein [Nonlabens ponticola]|uniref:PorT family protein n=1 Tax=Nonlabens ponticola TaxID=2496866 RepID=A0A3S9MVH6_9FLAO|nr:hypothetical protein [Nonlabens ponticola]AZQ43144.1 hypothetical protein EJ995_02425 [Nonlabens ponticola]
MKIYLVLSFCLFGLYLSAQRTYSSINRLGIGADATFLQLESDQVNIESETGFAGYLETRGDFNRYFDMVYSVGIFNHKFNVEEFQSTETIDMSVIGAEVKLLLAWRVFGSPYFTIEAGPAVMVNGEFKIDDSDLSRFVGTTDPILVSEFEKTNPININAVGGFSAGINNVRITAHYHYAFLDSLDSQTVSGSDVDGKLSYVSAGLRLYF